MGNQGTAIARLAITLTALVPTLLQGEMRNWKSADGKKTIKAELVEQTEGDVKLKRSDGKIFLFPRNLLSQRDQGFLDELVAADARKKAMENAKFLAAFNKVRFGSTPEQVATAMKSTPGVEGGVNEFFKNRMGMNGIFFTKVAGIRYDFFFEFNDDDLLKEISIRSSPFDPSQFQGTMQVNWRKLRTALRAALGSPEMQTELPAPGKLEENMAQSTDIWDKHGRGYYLGVGRADGGVTCVFRSRRDSYLKDAVPVGAPAKKRPGGPPSAIDL